MTGRTLIAGIGNVFWGDDAFGVEVARELATHSLPAGTIVSDVGVRGIHLAYELLEPLDLLVIADLAPRGGEPGTLYVLEPDDLEAREPEALADPHGMDLPTVFAALQTLGGTVPRVRIIGCEPADVGDHMGLSAPVRAAVPEAARLVCEVVERDVVERDVVERDVVERDVVERGEAARRTPTRSDRANLSPQEVEP